MNIKNNHERKIKAFEFAADIVKQFLTIAIAIVTLTATLTERYFSNMYICSKVMLMISWVVYIISILCGLLSLMKMATEIEPDFGEANITIKGGQCAKFALYQISAFFIGLFFIIFSGVFSLFTS